MRYLNVEKGIRKVLISQIFSIIAAILSGCTDLLSEAFSTFKNVIQEPSVQLIALLFLSAGVGVFLLATIVCYNIFGVIGYYQASRDEPMFKKSMICVLASGILTVIGILFQVPNGTLHTLFTTAGTIVEMFEIVFAIAGLINISESLDRTDFSERGDRLLKIMVFTYIITALNALIIRIFELSAEAKIVSMFVNAADLVLIITRYVFYLRYLNGAKKMIADSNADSLRG